MTEERRKGRFAYHGLDRVVHERARLGILSCLACSQSGRLTFNDLKELCELTDGNLSRHLHALQEAGIVEMERNARRGRPLTWVAFTHEGRERFLDYVDLLEGIARDSAEGLREKGGGDGVVPVPEG